MAVKAEAVEALLLSLGERGKYQMSMLLLLSCTYIILLFNHIIMAFHGVPVAHSCLPGGHVDVSNIYNDSSISNVSIYTLTGSAYGTNMTDGSHLMSLQPGSCEYTDVYTGGNNITTQCVPGQFVYSPKRGEKTIVSEFDLVCAHKPRASLATTIYFAGVMLGGLVFGDLADRLGRRPVLLATIYASVAVGVATAFSVSYLMFVVLRFVQGVLMQGLQTSAYTLAMEFFVARQRPLAGAVIETFFGSSVMLLAFLAYLLPDWRHLQLAISLPGVAAFVYACLVPESLRWLVMKGKFEKGDELLRKICQRNQCPYPAMEWRRVKEETSTALSLTSHHQQHSMLDLFKTAQLRRRTLPLMFIWLTISTCYYGLTFKLTTLTGNKHLNVFIGGAVETLCYVLSLPVMRLFGRKKPLFVCFVCASATCLAAGFIADHTSDMTHLITGLVLAGRCSAAFLFAIIFVFTSELFPTLIRNIGVGFCCFWARLGGVIAPQINQWSGTVAGFDAIIIFGGLSGVAALCVAVLPETHNHHLPDGIHDMTEQTSQERSKHNRYQGHRNCSTKDMLKDDDEFVPLSNL